MKANQIQSLIALNSKRITDLHRKVEGGLKDAKGFKLARKTTAKQYLGLVDQLIAKAYSVVSTASSDLKKATEIQKALKAELRNVPKEVVVKPAAQNNVRFFTNKTGFGDDTLVVESVGGSHYVCHKADGTTSVLGGGDWHKVGDFGLNRGTLIEHKSLNDALGKKEFNIEQDGQPKENGAYEVKYSATDTFDRIRYFKDGVWYGNEACTIALGFGNMPRDFANEFYRKA